MPLKAVNIAVSDEGLAAYVSDILFEMGALSVSLTDRNYGKSTEQPLYHEPGEQTYQESISVKPWNNAHVTALYPLSVDVEALIMLIATHFNLPSTPTFTIQSEHFDEKTPDEWVRHVQSSFQPIELGPVRISFPWHDRRTDLIDILLEPGLAFGTGEHATTQLCLTWLSTAVKPASTVLDFGTGSGVLAIASVMLAPDVSAVGVDIDERALCIARENAVLNKVDKSIEFFANEHEPCDRVYDVVVANILAKPLKQLASQLVTRLRPGGFIAMSGLLVSQAPQLVEWYANYGISLHDAQVKSGWTLLVGVKR